jgi:hypothetical protein
VALRRRLRRSATPRSFADKSEYVVEMEELKPEKHKTRLRKRKSGVEAEAADGFAAAGPTIRHRRPVDKRRGGVYLIEVFILAVVAAAASGMLLFKTYDRAVQLYDKTGEEKAVRLVELGITMWLIFVLSAAVWLITVVFEWGINRGGGPVAVVGHSCDGRRGAETSRARIGGKI